ncbi:MAG: CPBP family intramembrane glutamic endopeptidase [Stackebrandtia sp.]
MNIRKRPSVVAFFVLAFAMAIPIIAVGLLIPAVPNTPKNGPITDLALAFVPMTAAMILIYRYDGAAGVKSLLRRAVDRRLIAGKGWWVVIVATMPLITLTTFAVTALMGQSTVSDTAIPWEFMPVLYVIFWFMAAGEEIGWLGYAMDPLQRRFGALGACVVFSIPWTVAHIPSILMMGQTWTYIGAQFLASVGIRIIWQWVYNNNARSILAVICMHAFANICGTYFMQQYDVATIVVVAALIVLIFGARTLTRSPRQPVPA